MISIVSYNVNGIRAAEKKGLSDWIIKEQPDVLWLQETKAQAGQINLEKLEAAGYTTFWHSAVKKGYSGVALITKLKPERMVIGMQNHKYDAEGRVLRADFGDITMLGCYFPSGTTGDIRQTFKMEFLADFQAYVDELKKDRPNLIISGDLNIAHTEIDINHPKRHHKTSGFLPEERQWLTEFLKSGFIDSFRFIDDRAEQYSWWTYRANARAKNLGWRIDYNLVSESMQERICGASILQDIIHSDHCPVKVEIRQ